MLHEDALDRMVFESTAAADTDEKGIILTIVLVPLVIVAAAVIGCCCFPRLSRVIDNMINQNNRGESDRRYHDVILRQQLAEQEKNKEEPSERRERLIQHFERNSVKMVS